jgi:uncharacterized membrane protein
MARETSGGRIGRTVYLPQEVWDRLETLANKVVDHPAYRPWEIRQGSVSSVIEAILQWDAPAAIRQANEKAAKAERKLEGARAVKAAAARLIDKLQLDTASIVAELIKLRDSDV